MDTSQVQALLTHNITQCPVCSNNQLALFKKTIWKGINLKYDICKKCSLVFLNPQMSEMNTNVFYDKYYRLVYEGSENPTDEVIKYQEGRAQYFNQIIKPYLNEIKPDGLVLDIGSSGGVLLDMMNLIVKDSTKIFGVEPGEAYRNYSNQKGYNVVGNLDEIDKSLKGKFQVITMSHVLEHIAYPVGYLEKISEYLCPKTGIFMIEVPNLYGHASFEVAHNICFTRKTLVDSIKLAGLEVVNIHSHANPLPSQRPMFLNALVKVGNQKTKPTTYPNYLVNLFYKLGPNNNPNHYKYFKTLIN